MADIVKKKWIHDIKEVKEDGTVVLGDQVAPMTFMECVIDANGNTFENKLANVEANVATRLATKVSEAPYDDQYYARFNGEWKVVPGTGGAIAAEDVTFDVTGTAIPAANDTVQKAIAYVAENAGGNVEVDGTTISKTADDKLQIKDGGVSADKLDAALTAEIAGKVDAETGKGLSSNDYTNAEKAKVALVPTTLTTDLAKLAALPDASALEADLDLKADKDSPALTGTPTAPTADAGTNTTQIATTAFVTSAVDDETTARTSAIAAETSARTAADNTLTANLETLATKEANDVNGLQAQITAGVATSGTITMAAVMDGTTDYSAETDVAPSRHAVQSFVNAQDAQLETEIEDLAQKVSVLEAGGASPEFIAALLNTWLDNHPEATTSVLDGSISYAKLSAELKQKIDNMPQIEVEDTSGDPIELYTKDECDAKFALKGESGGGSIDKVKVNGTELTISSADKSVNIPAATSTAYGVIKIWTGTLDGYNAIATKDASCFYCITE